MIRLKIDIDQYNWHVMCYLAVSTYYTEEISRELKRIGCDYKDFRRAVRNMNSGKKNQGFCFSNPYTGESVMVVGLTSSAAQFQDSLIHELRHLANQICNAWDIPLASEESCYLSGGLAQKIFPFAEKLLCEHCRQNQL